MMRSIFIIALLVASTFAGTPEAMMLLKANCFSCHNPDKEKGGLNLTTREGLLRGSEEGKVINPGKAPSSRIIQVIQTGSDPHMPPKGQLSPRAISTLEDWVNAGAEWDAAALKDKPRPTPAQLGALPVNYTPALHHCAAARGARARTGARPRATPGILREGFQGGEHGCD